MSIEERLYTLATQLRDQQGGALLSSASQLVPRLSAQAPDLYYEIAALAALIEGNAAGRIAAAADAEAEAQRITGEVAASHRMSRSAVAPALAVARRLGAAAPAFAAMPQPQPVAGGWAGDSVAVGAPSPPPPPSYAGPPTPPPLGGEEPFWKSKWAIGGAAAVALFFGYQSLQRAPQGRASGGTDSGTLPPPPPQPTPCAPGDTACDPLPPPQDQNPPPPPPATDSQNPPANTGNAPLLARPGNGDLPTIQGQQAPNGGITFAFSIPSQAGTLPGMIMLPPQGWDNGPAVFGFGRPGSSGNFETFGKASFQANRTQQGTVRVARPQWEKDGIGLKDICIAFQGRQQGAQDVQLPGATMCVLDSQCGQPLGCATIR